jgi:AcrR family transcriptional regulator
MLRRRKVPTTIKDAIRVEKRRERIFQAASKLIPKKGCHNTTLRDISKETGITLGSLYNYIATKEDILYIVHEKTVEMVIQAREKAESYDGDPLRRLREMIARELEVIDKYQDLIMCIYQGSHALSKKSLKSMLRSEESHLESFEAVLKEGMESGLFKSGNHTMLAHIIKMMIDCWVLRRWALRKKVSLEEMGKNIIDMVQVGILKDLEGVRTSF